MRRLLFKPQASGASFVDLRLLFFVTVIGFCAVPRTASAQPAITTTVILQDPLLGRIAASGLTLDPATGRVFAIGFNDFGQVCLATIDTGSDTFSAVDLGRTIMTFGTTFPLAFDPLTNQLYTVGTNDFGESLLGRIDPTTGTVVTQPFGIFVQDGIMQFDQASGMLDLLTNSGGDVTLYWIDPATALSSPINSFRTSGILGFDDMTKTIYNASGDSQGQINVYAIGSWQLNIGRVVFPYVIGADTALGNVYLAGSNDQGQIIFAVIGPDHASVSTTDFGRVVMPNAMTVDPSSHSVYLGGYNDQGQPVIVRIAVSSANTSSGSNIAITPTVSLPNGSATTVSMTFDNVATGGNTTVTASPAGTPPPSGFKLTNPPVYYEITTTAQFSGNVRVCLNWSEGQIANENHVSLFHYEGGHWVDITDRASRDTVNNKVCGTASSLSPFTIFETKYPFTGFFQPVDNSPTVNKTKAGSAIPVKFSLGGNRGLNIFAAGFPRVATIQCDTQSVTDDIEQTVTAGGSSLTYDTTTGQYTYVWKTDKLWAGSCRQLQIEFDDGETYTAKFNLTK